MATCASGFWSRSMARPYLRPEVRIGPSRRSPFPWSPVKAALASGRLPYQLLADAMASQYPPHRQLLEQANLKLPNGGCCLPVAYILSYALLEEGQIGARISRLKKVLDDGSITGDHRVEWLLALAQAERIRRAPTQIEAPSTVARPSPVGGPRLARYRAPGSAERTGPSAAPTRKPSRR